MNPNTFSANLQNTLTYATTNITASIISFVPQLLGALIVMLVGLVVSNWLKILIKEVLHTLNLSQFIKHSSVHTFLKQANIQYKVEELIGDIVKWLVLYVFSIAALNIVGLNTVSQFLTGILGLIPNLVSAAFIFIAGVLLAGFAESLVKNTLMPIDMPTARFAGKVTSYLIMVLGMLIALSELGIGEQFINIVFIGFVAMLALTFGLAFGLGAKDLVKEMLNTWFTTFKKERIKK